MTSSIRVVGVSGAGQMGSGIAQIAAASGLNVILNDISEESLQVALKSISSSLLRFVKKGAISQKEAESTVGRITTSRDLSDMVSADFVIEAVAENEDLKTKIFSELDSILKPKAIIASNTSSISITRLASATRRPGKVIGMHFMNPPPIMQLVEVVRGMATEDEVVETTENLAKLMGKVTCRANDFPGFIVNRILMPMINEAFFALQEGVASAENIDSGMRLGTNQPLGPLALADLIGLDTCLSIMRVLHEGLGDSKYRPSPLLVQYVDAGRLGRKSGRGVYEYDVLR